MSAEVYFGHSFRGKKWRTQIAKAHALTKKATDLCGKEDIQKSPGGGRNIGAKPSVFWIQQIGDI